MSAYARFFIHFAPHPISFIHSFLFLSDLSLRIIYPFCSPPHGISHPVTVIATRACSVRGTCPYRLRVQRKASGGARGPFSFHIKIKKASGRAYALTLFCSARSALHLLAEEARHSLRELALRLAGGAVAVRGHEQHAAEHVALGEDGRGDGDCVALVGVDDRQRAAVL